jgi:hypothetical protein
MQPADLERKLATYTGASGGFKLYSDPAAKNLRLGKGYFIRLESAASITKTGTAAPTDRPFSIPVTAGWNLIGDPFLTSVRWADVQVQVTGSQPVSQSQAVEQGILRPGQITLSGSSYRDSSTLEPWTGNWVRANRSATLLIPPPTASAASQSAQSRPWDPKQDPPPPVP